MLSSLPKVLRGRRDVCTVSHVVLQSAGYVTSPWRVLDGCSASESVRLLRRDGQANISSRLKLLGRLPELSLPAAEPQLPRSAGRIVLTMD